MDFDYNANFPSEEEILQAEIYNPEEWLSRYVIISSKVSAFYEGLVDFFNEHYSSSHYAQIIGMPVRRNRTVNFFIVMSKHNWEFVKTMYNGDLNKYYKSLQRKR